MWVSFVVRYESSDQSYMVPSEATVDSARLAPFPSISELSRLALLGGLSRSERRAARPEVDVKTIMGIGSLSWASSELNEVNRRAQS